MFEQKKNETAIIHISRNCGKYEDGVELVHGRNEYS